MLTPCDREPIQAPGGIQPHGYLFVIDESTLRVLQVSANVSTLTHLTLDETLGAGLADVLGERLAACVGEALAMQSPDLPLDDAPLYLGEVVLAGASFDGVLHRRASVLMLELESRPDHVHDTFASIYPLVRGFVASLQRAEPAYRYELRHTLVDVLSSMAGHERFVDALVEHSHSLLKLGAATGAAIVVDAHPTLLGQTPHADQVLSIVDWIAEHASGPVFATDHLGDLLPVGVASPDELHEHTSGLLAVSISQLYRHYVIWFRPEVLREIDWAGDPGEPRTDTPGADGGDTEISPRRGFASWRETVRGHSTRWCDAEIETALELRTAILGYVLRRAEEMAALASELGRANKELEAFSYSISHDLRAPLRHIVGYGDMLGEFEGDRLTERGHRFLANVLSSARFAGALVDDLLSFSQMGRAALRVTDVDLRNLVDSLIAEFARDVEGRTVEWHVGELPQVLGDAIFLQLALRNLMSNALKYSRSRNPAIIEFGSRIEGAEHIVFIRDNGVGFNMKYVGKLFGVFQRLHSIEEFEGTGVGLANVRRIIERHDGRTWAEGRQDDGATFYFSLPVAGPADPAASFPGANGTTRRR